MNIQTATKQPYAELDQLIEQLDAAKKFEEEAKLHRITIEQKIIEVAGVKPEGSSTVKTDHFAITTTGKVSRKFDQSKWAIIQNSIPEKLQPVKVETKLDLAKLRYLENNEPQYYNVVAQCITTSPNKPSVSFKPLEQK